MTNTVICLKWGTKYGPEYVNRLNQMVQRNLGQAKLICFTDNTKDIDPSIRCEPIPTDIPEITGWWLKLSLFQKNLAGLSGPVLYLDLDTVVVNRLEPFFAQRGSFCIIQDWLYRKYREHKYNSSVMRFNIGDFDYVWQDFLSHRSRIMQMLPGDQDWITDKIPEATKWPDNWCISYKWDKAWANIPQQTKIVVFHGTPNPPEAIQGTDKYPPAPWIANLWR